MSRSKSRPAPLLVRMRCAARPIFAGSLSRPARTRRSSASSSVSVASAVSAVRAVSRRARAAERLGGAAFGDALLCRGGRGQRSGSVVQPLVMPCCVAAGAGSGLDGYGAGPVGEGDVCGAAAVLGDLDPVGVFVDGREGFFGGAVAAQPRYRQHLTPSTICSPYKSPPEHRLATQNPTSAAICCHQTPANPPNSGPTTVSWCYECTRRTPRLQRWSREPFCVVQSPPSGERSIDYRLSEG